MRDVSESVVFLGGAPSIELAEPGPRGIGMAAEVVVSDDVAVVGVGPPAGAVEGVSEAGAFEDSGAAGVVDEDVSRVGGYDWGVIIFGVGVIGLAGWDPIEVVIGIERDGEEELSEITGAGGAAGAFFGGGEGGEEEGGEDTDDGDYGEEFDEREGWVVGLHGWRLGREGSFDENGGGADGDGGGGGADSIGERDEGGPLGEVGGGVE
ncbi:MAG: hypothetical protein RI897_1431 [Verrucomicrobiota bacterium]